MPETAVLLTAATVCLAGVMSPGPNFVAVSHRAVSTTRHEALSMVAGITLVNLLWAAIAVFGVGLLLASVPSLLGALKLCGAVYLVGFGLRLIRRSATPLADQGGADAPRSLRSALRDGLATNFANPNSMAFYASVFAGVVPAHASTQTLWLLVALVGVIGAFWYGSVAVVFSSGRVVSLYRRGKTLIERACGLFLIGFALRLLWQPA